jgi:hypothetical protein
MNAPLRRLFGDKAPDKTMARLGMSLRDFPDYAAAEDLLRGQRAKHQALAAELVELDRKLHASDDAELDELAMRELRGEDVEAADLRAQRQEVVQRLQIVGRAEQMAREAFQAVKTKRSAELMRLHLPKIRARVRGIARALWAVHLANRALEAATRELEAAGVSLLDSGMSPFIFPAGDMHNARSGWGSTPAEVWLASARNHGLISPDEVLADLEVRG